MGSNLNLYKKMNNSLLVMHTSLLLGYTGSASVCLHTQNVGGWIIHFVWSVGRGVLTQDRQASHPAPILHRIIIIISYRRYGTVFYYTPMYPTVVIKPRTLPPSYTGL